jgi:hypothetical protein
MIVWLKRYLARPVWTPQWERLQHPRPAWRFRP